MQAHHERTDWTEPQQVSALVLAMGDGRLDAWSGRMVRAGADTVESLVARAADGLRDVDRTITLVPWGDTDPLG
jgi:hypothetical protein